jgi:hypothetical protein
MQITHPFAIGGWVLLSDYHYAFCTLPPHDADILFFGVNQTI